MEQQIIDLLRRIKNLEARLGITETVESEVSGGTPHDILSATHTDATVSAVTQGALIAGNATPEWDDLPIGKLQELLTVNAAGTDPVWKAFDWDDINDAAGADMEHDHSNAAEGGTIAAAALAHNVLSATHTDAAVSDVTQGDLIFGNSTPAWDDLAIGTARQLLAVNVAGTEPEWKSFDWDDMGAAVGADMAHDHSGAAEGGTIAAAALAHNVLSATHSDATVSAVTQGDLVYGNSTPAWDDLAIGTTRKILAVNAAGTEPEWVAFDWDNQGAAAGADMAHNHSAAGEGGEIPVASLGGYSQGDIIRGGAADWEDYSAKTNHFILVGDGTDIISKAFDWDDVGAGAGADMVHSHASDAEGSKLDWDDVWTDAVHDHSSAAEGGQTIDVNGQADAIVLDADGDTSISAPTDDQIDIEINNADDFTFTANTFTALSGSTIATDTISETTGAAGVTIDSVLVKDNTVSAQTFAFICKNTSAAVATANDVGYINEDGEYKTTTTANLNVAWCVVLVGGADNADIYVTRRGRVTVTLNGDCSAGDYLYTSTTAGQAQPLAYVRPEVFAVALTANAGGAGGTCSALLYCHRSISPSSSTNNILSVAATSSSDFVATLNGAPAGTAVVYNAPGTGTEDAIVPGASTELGKILLWNTSKGPAQSAKITAVNTGTNTITVSDAADVATWLNGETITVRSQTNTDNIGASYFYDVEVTSTEIPALTTALIIDLIMSDTGGANASMRIHPWETGASSKRRAVITQSTYNTSILGEISPLINRRYTTEWLPTGVSTGTITERVAGIVVAEP